MIDKNGGTFSLICDVCGEQAEKQFFDFYDAVEYKKDKDNGWISQKTDDGWQDICPDCKEAE